MENNWEFHHVAVVVQDMDKAVKYYQSLGIGEFLPEFMLDSSTYTEYEVYGKTSDSIDKTRMRFIQIGPSFKLELVQPLEGEPIYKEFLKSEGEGVHHIAYTVDDLDREIAKLAKKGIPIITRVKTQTGGFAYCDTRKVGNVIIELIQRR